MPSWNSLPQSIKDRFSPPPDRCNFLCDEEYEQEFRNWRRQIQAGLRSALQEHRETPRRLVYRVSPYNNCLVFAEPDRAEHIARIHRAIKKSKTWGAFRRAMPPGEFERLQRSMMKDDEFEMPSDRDPFGGEQLPGWSDGDYPAWLQQEMDLVLPQAVLGRFGRQVATAINGFYWEISESRMNEVCTALMDLGFELERKQTLPFH